MLTALYLAIFFSAAATGWALTPLLRRAALRYGIVDRPDRGLKQQAAPVAYLGGAAVLGGVLAGLAVFAAFPGSSLPATDQLRSLGLLLGALLLAGLGLWDDLRNLSPYGKLAVQAAVAVLAIAFGVHMQIVFFPTWLNYALTVFWLVGMTNAFNLIDIMDGLASGVTVIAALVFFLLAVTAVGLDKTFVAVWALALAGGAIGFLRHNFHPATIYLGDLGALSIGFLMGGLAIAESYTIRTNFGILVPLFVLVIPLYDTFYVIVLRLLAGKSIFHGSRDHFALRLRALGLSVPGTVLVCYAISIAFGGVALILTLTAGLPAALLTSVLCLLALTVGFVLSRVRMQ